MSKSLEKKNAAVVEESEYSYEYTNTSSSLAIDIDYREYDFLMETQQSSLFKTHVYSHRTHTIPNAQGIQEQLSIVIRM